MPLDRVTIFLLGAAFGSTAVAIISPTRHNQTLEQPSQTQPVTPGIFMVCQTKDGTMEEFPIPSDGILNCNYISKDK